jgi:hypothetical protein
MPMVLRGGQRARSGLRLSPRIIIALVIALVSIVGYFGNRAINPVTGRKQSLAMNVEQDRKWRRSSAGFRGAPSGRGR